MRWAPLMDPLEFTLLGQAASKSNRRQLVTVKGKPRLIKSKEARAFYADAVRQIPPCCRLRLRGPISLVLRIFYSSDRPDLSEEVVMDAMQTQWRRVPLGPGKFRREMTQPGVYENDRQVVRKFVYKFIDRINPRVEVSVLALAPDLFVQAGQEMPEDPHRERDHEELPF